MRVTWQSEWPHWLLIGLLLVVLALTPATTIPIHWNLAGRPDGFADKWVAGLLVVGVYALFLVLPRLDPGRANYAQFAGAFNVIRLAVLVMLVVLLGSGALGVRSGGLVNLLVGALFVVLGAVLGKIRPNWFVGIRTPWTLASKRSWVKTHRVGGWLFIAWGVVEIAVALLLPASQPAAILVGAALVVGILTVYSYLVWRADPDKEPAISARPAP